MFAHMVPVTRVSTPILLRWSLVVGISLLAWSCEQEELPTGPSDASMANAPASLAFTQAPEGCATLVVKLSGRDGITVSSSSAPDCGPLRLVVDGLPSYDRVEGTVRLPVAVDNLGSNAVRQPVLLATWADSLNVLSPPGLAQNPHAAGYLDPLVPDSVAGPNALTWPDARIWKLLDETTPDELPAGVRQRFSGATVEVAVHDGVLSFELRARLRARQGGIQIPDQAPEQYPPDLLENFDEEWQVPNDILAVTFLGDATPTEKRAAAESAGAIAVVGGARIPGEVHMDGIYLFRIETDGTIQPLLGAVERLRAMAQVVSAFMFSSLGSEWRQPQDGGDWSAWRVRPDSADTRNWAQELIAAPLAWGCETGSPAAEIAIVDKEFFPVSDLAGNLANPISSSGSAAHGTRVASIIGAVGDNGAQTSGMTGMMWNASLRLYDFQQAGAHPNPTASIIHRLAAAAGGGARVVNISQGYYWQQIHGRPPNTSSPSDSMKVHDVYHAFRDHLSNLQRYTPNLLPLLVVTAGNDGIDAFWNATPQLVQDFPRHVLVVGGTEHMRPRPDGSVDLSNYSNHGGLVDIVAPGEDVYSLDGNGNVTAVDGTSFAAPFATGTAGLLLSFDPSIPVEDVKDIIVRGSVAGGRTATGTGGPYPLLNAYEALKAAARRPGAPLCASRLAADGTELYAERESGWEHILDLGGDFGYLNPLHGGRTIDAYVFDLTTGTSEYDRFELQAGGWTRTGAAPSFPHGGPSDGSMNNSIHGRSHSADTTAHLRQLDWASRDFGVRVYQSTSRTNVYHDHTIHEPYDFTSSSACVVKFGESCRRSIGLYEGDVIRPGPSGMRVAWVPQGGKVVVWFVRGTRTSSLGGWYGCGDDHVCRNHEYSDEWARTDFYEMDVTTGDRRRLFSIPYAAGVVGVSEDGREIMVARYFETFESLTWYETYTNRWGELRPEPHDSSRREATDCSVEWYDYETGDVLATAPFSKTCRISEDLGDDFQDTYDWFIGSMSP